MKAYVRLWCDHAGIVRVGPKWKNLATRALPFRIENGWATFEGLCFAATVSATKAAINAVETSGLRVLWERRKGGIIREVKASVASEISSCP